MEKLKEYRRKREFNRTKEPAGSDSEPSVSSSKDGALRFVIQKHQASHLHFDLRLEMDGVLKSWAVPKGPSIKAGERRLAVEVEDHPIEYGKFEGTIPKGEYGGGTVMLWDHGNWTPAPKGRVEEGRIDFVLEGQKLQGAWSLIRTKSDPAKKNRKPNWLLIKRSDSGCKTSKLDDISVVTGRTMDEITAGAPVNSTEEAVEDRLAQVSAAKGGKVKTLRPKKKKSTDDLANALEASLKRERDELIRGYEVEPDKFIEVSDDNVVDLRVVLKQRLKGD